jgi:hypothetical protein
VHQHRGQQEGEQKEDVIEADPDVPDAFDQILAELRQARALAGDKVLFGALRGEDGGMRRAVESQAQQAAVQGVEFEQQR